jgi:hypothetical protein
MPAVMDSCCSDTTRPRTYTKRHHNRHDHHHDHPHGHDHTTTTVIIIHQIITPS